MTGLMDMTHKLFTGWGFLTFPLVGGIVGLVAMHIFRVQRWLKLHRRYMEEYEGWTTGHTIGIVVMDEAVWLLIFAPLCYMIAAAM